MRRHGGRRAAGPSGLPPAFDLRRGSRRTRAFVFAAASCLLLPVSGDRAAPRDPPREDRVPPIGAASSSSRPSLPTVVDEERRFSSVPHGPAHGPPEPLAFRDGALRVVRAGRTGRSLSVAMLTSTTSRRSTTRTGILPGTPSPPSRARSRDDPRDRPRGRYAARSSSCFSSSDAVAPFALSNASGRPSRPSSLPHRSAITISAWNRVHEPRSSADCSRLVFAATRRSTPQGSRPQQGHGRGPRTQARLRGRLPLAAPEEPVEPPHGLAEAVERRANEKRTQRPLRRPSPRHRDGDAVEKRFRERARVPHGDAPRSPYHEETSGTRLERPPGGEHANPGARVQRRISRRGGAVLVSIASIAFALLRALQGSSRGLGTEQTFEFAWPTRRPIISATGFARTRSPFAIPSSHTSC